MNCCSCHHARQAGNKDLVGCCFWTAIYHGNLTALRSALAYINKKEKFKINLDSRIVEKEAIGFLIDILIEDYAPKPFYDGWADLNSSRDNNKETCEMSDSCIVLNPNGSCNFYAYKNQNTSELFDERIATQNQ